MPRFSFPAGIKRPPMLEVFRRASRSWIAKGLFVLLILSFGVWGVGDMVQVGVSNAPAVVAGKVEISAEQVVADYRRELQRLQRVFGAQFDDEQAQQMGLLERTLDNVVARALLDQATLDLDMITPDDVLTRQIAQNPAFRNGLGQFDPSLFRQAIGAAGFTEPQFMAMARNDLKRGQLLAALTEGVNAPAPLAAPLFAFRGERRVAEIVEIATASLPQPAPPPAEELQKFWQDRQAQFMAPEYRTITAILLRPADVQSELQIGDKDIEEAYAQRHAEFIQPERRTVRQILLQDQEAAQRAADMAKTTDFAEAAKQLNQPVLELGETDRESLETIAPALAEAVFSTAAGGIAGPVQTPLGWHVAQVGDIQPGKEQPLAEVRGQLVQDLAHERAVDLLYERANKIEDTLAGGATLEETAHKLDLPMVKATIDRRGADSQGQPVQGLPASEKFLSTVFATPEGADTRMNDLENDGGFFIALVEKVTPPAAKPFETVQADVLAAWQEDQRVAAAKAKAEEAANRLKAGETAAAVAQAVGGEAKTTQPVTRNPQPGSVSPQLASELFKLQPGGVAVVQTETGATAARLQQVQPVDAQAQAAMLEQLRQQLGQAVEGDLVDQLVAGLNAKYGARINRQVVEERLR